MLTFTVLLTPTWKRVLDEALVLENKTKRKLARRVVRATCAVTKGSARAMTVGLGHYYWYGGGSVTNEAIQYWALG